MNCPAYEQLLDYIDGRLALASTEVIASHLVSGCGNCKAGGAWYQEVKLVVGSDDSIEPPPWVLKRALKVFDTASVRTRTVRRVGRLIASLVFDSFKGPALAGARSSAVEGRQMLYRAEDYSIDIQVDALDQRHAELTGQILREGELTFESVGGLQLDLMRDGGTIQSTVTNDRGEFRVTNVDPGSYDLRVDATDASITIVGLPIE